MFSKSMDNYFIFRPKTKDKGHELQVEKEKTENGLRFKYYINSKPYTTRGNFEHIIEELIHCT